MKSIPAYIDDYLQQLIKQGRATSTINTYRSDLMLFHSWLRRVYPGSTIESITGSHLEEYFNHLHKKKYSNNSLHRVAVVLNNLLVYSNNANVPNLLKSSTVKPKSPLKDNDFITDSDFMKLIKSVKRPSDGPRDYLINRNLSIIRLMREHGFSSKQLSSINMEKINFAQNEININNSVYKLNEETMRITYDYFKSIPEQLRPRLYSKDPLFVSFNSRSLSFQYDYASGKPKRLSDRTVREIVKSESVRASLGWISPTHLRNACILDKLRQEVPDLSIGQYFGLSTSPTQLNYSLKRYKQYLNQIKEEK